MFCRDIGSIEISSSWHGFKTVGENAYEIEDGTSDNGVECRGAGQVEQAIKAAEADREDSGADGEVARGAHDGKESRKRNTALKALKNRLAECFRARRLEGLGVSL